MKIMFSLLFNILIICFFFNAKTLNACTYGYCNSYDCCTYDEWYYNNWPEKCTSGPSLFETDPVLGSINYLRITFLILCIIFLKTNKKKTSYSHSSNSIWFSGMFYCIMLWL